MSQRPPEVCPPGAITRRTAILVWGVPILAIVAGIVWRDLLLWLAIPAFTAMGVACVANATRCGRLHCYATGPLFLGMAALLAGVALGWLPSTWIDVAGWIVVAGVVLAFGAERASGRPYASRGDRAGS